MRTIALTGAGGFVGQHILRALLDRRSFVRLLVRPGSIHHAEPPPGVDVRIVPDLFKAREASLIDHLKGVDTLIHAAWYTEHAQYLQSPQNIDCMTGSIALAQAFAAAGGRRFVGIGSCAEYDTSAGFLKASSPLKPRLLYGACKASVFQVLSELLPMEGMEFAWCRLFYLHGEGEDARRLVPYLHEQMRKGLPAQLSSGHQVRDYLDVRDAGVMIADTALGNIGGPINICSGIPISVRQLAEGIADQYDRRDLLQFGARPDNLQEPPCVVGIKE